MTSRRQEPFPLFTSFCACDPVKGRGRARHIRTRWSRRQRSLACSSLAAAPCDQSALIDRGLPSVCCSAQHARFGPVFWKHSAAHPSTFATTRKTCPPACPDRLRSARRGNGSAPAVAAAAADETPPAHALPTDLRPGAVNSRALNARSPAERSARNPLFPVRECSFGAKNRHFAAFAERPHAALVSRPECR